MLSLSRLLKLSSKFKIEKNRSFWLLGSNNEEFTMKNNNDVKKPNPKINLKVLSFFKEKYMNTNVPINKPDLDSKE